MKTSTSEHVSGLSDIHFLYIVNRDLNFDSIASIFALNLISANQNNQDCLYFL